MQTMKTYVHSELRQISIIFILMYKIIPLWDNTNISIQNFDYSLWYSRLGHFNNYYNIKDYNYIIKHTFFHKKKKKKKKKKKNILNLKSAN